MIVNVFIKFLKYMYITEYYIKKVTIKMIKNK